MDTRESLKQQPRALAGSFAYDGLDRAIHERARLGIMTSLVTHPDGLLFGDLKEMCALTDGNLNRHLKVLREGGLVDVTRQGRGKGSQTICRVTSKGRTQFVEYLRELENVIRDAAEATAAVSHETLPRSAIGGVSPA
ncbi:MAG: transcriptional regulator [Planctomycetes bacterium]|nr:transcriptional regulator [Planctomycetota bacterium]MBL7040435.1 transcriptional regulator [Pirellulaceae bacterium]